MAPFYLMPEKSDEMFVEYADGHLSETEKMLLKLYKEFLGEKNGS